MFQYALLTTAKVFSERVVIALGIAIRAFEDFFVATMDSAVRSSEAFA